jgi:hypothetical protein
MDWNSTISGMQYPHWLMVGGGVLVTLGFFGFIFHKNRNPDTDEDNLKQTPPSDPIQAALEVEMKGKGK